MYLRAERARRRNADSDEGCLKSSASLWGLGLQIGAFVVSYLFRRRSPEQLPVVLTLVAIVLAPWSLATVLWAMSHLGKHFRIRAAVTTRHELVTTGPYRLVRHPVYLSVLGMLIANAILLSRLEAGLVGVVICLTGTEIRVRAEDNLLAKAFAEDFSAYRRRVYAYLPLIR
jgi:protein-S-isoprenylcysteine O-methyltransferase Ste14